MSAQISLYLDHLLERPVDEIQLSEVWVDSDSRLGQGQATRIFGCNSGSTTIRDFTVALDGEGAGSIQLALDDEGNVGVWAAPGESILVAQFLDPRDEFSFWARGLFEFGETEGPIDFDFLFQGTSIG